MCIDSLSWSSWIISEIKCDPTIYKHSWQGPQQCTHSWNQTNNVSRKVWFALDSHDIVWKSLHVILLFCVQKILVIAQIFLHFQRFNNLKGDCSVDRKYLTKLTCSRSEIIRNLSSAELTSVITGILLQQGLQRAFRYVVPLRLHLHVYIYSCISLSVCGLFVIHYCEQSKQK